MKTDAVLEITDSVKDNRYSVEITTDMVFQIKEDTLIRTNWSK